jgi:NADP-dependent 3-hydroxy acid dehydrogenase YdfG
MNKELIIITGAGNGIGKFIALNIANGTNFILCISKSRNCQETADKIMENGFQADFICLDLADFIKSKESVSNWLKIKKKFTKINLVLAAGYLGKPCINDEEFDLNDWLISYQINLLGNLAILNGVLPEMKVLNNSKVIFFSSSRPRFFILLYAILGLHCK